MKRFFLFLTALCLASMLSAQSGKCGPNLYWSLDKSTRTVTITGTGPMYDYTDNGNKETENPWRKYKEYVYHFDFKGTPTSFGNKAFFGLINCYSISIPSSITSIDFSFWRAPFKEINIPASVSFIKPGVFALEFDLIALNVDKNNPYYCSIDGVLFNKSKTTLIHYPNAKPDVSYIIPSSVTNVELIRNKYLLTLTIPNSVVSMKCGDITAETQCGNLQTIFYEQGFNPLLTTEGKKAIRQINYIMIESQNKNQSNSSSTKQSAKERLESLQSLYNSGLISKEEYDRKRNEIISTL